MIYEDRMKAGVLGTGCAECDTAEKIVKEVVEKSGVDAEIVELSDIIFILKDWIYDAIPTWDTFGRRQPHQIL